MMDELDPMAEMQHAMHMSDSRYAKQSEMLEEMPEHLKQTTTINRKQRRLATIQSPSDRMALSSEPKPQSQLHYVATQQSPGKGQPPIKVGRVQDPRNKNASERERHIFEQGTRGAPSYPKEATNLNKIGTSQNFTHPQLFGQINKAMSVDPIDVTGEKEQRHLMTTANIVGIAESRRDPFMGFSSTQTFDFAEQEDSKLTPDEVFGKRSGKKNLPGVLPASGTGAVGMFRSFRSDVEKGQQPTDEHGKRLYKNIRRQHLALMRQGYHPATVKRLLAEGMSPADIRIAMRARMRSAATRRAAYNSGQLRYRLRNLRRDKLDPKQAKIDMAKKLTKKKRNEAVNKRRGLL